MKTGKGKTIDEEIGHRYQKYHACYNYEKFGLGSRQRKVVKFQKETLSQIFFRLDISVY